MLVALILNSNLHMGIFLVDMTGDITDCGKALQTLGFA